MPATGGSTTPRPRTRRAGIRQVAHAAGVSEATVSNVLNNPAIVAPQTRQRVEQAMVDVGFVRNRAAVQLRGRPSSVIGCVLLDLANAFFAEVARGIEDRLAEADCMHLVCSSDIRIERENRYLRMFEEHGVRGVIVHPATANLDGLVALSQRGVPVVLLDQPQAGTGLCTVTVDNVAGGRLAAGHLLALGHRRLVYLRGTRKVSTVNQRREGARQACLAAGLDPESTIQDVSIDTTPTGGGAEAAVTRLLSLDPVPTAVICFNDAAAVGVLRGLRQAGVEVPEQMSVIGYDDMQFAAELSPPLTTVRQPRYELGRAAAELVLAESDEGHDHQERVFAPRLIVRASCGPAPPSG